MKKGFTLVELIAVLAIFLIGGSLTFGIFNSSYKLFNRGEQLLDVQDSFRNATLDMEKEVNDYGVLEYKIKDIGNYNINNYQDINPLLLIDKGENSVLYFKGKKGDNNLEIVEKIIFDKNSIANNSIYVKESKTIINGINGNIELKNLSDDLLEMKFDFTISNSNENRIYFTTINLDRNETEESIDIAAGNTQTPNEPENDNSTTKPEDKNEIVEGPSEEPLTEADVINTSNIFAKQSTFIVLDQNQYNAREDLINIESISGNNSNINISNSSFYIQAISTDIMKKYIDTSYVVKNDYQEGSKKIKAPALNSRIYTSSGLNIASSQDFKDVTNVKNNVVKYIKNGTNNVACIYGKGNDYILLINGDLDISSDSDITLQAPNSSHKLTIYATGKINITNTSGTLNIINCSLISANQINIKTNSIIIKSEKVGYSENLKEVLDENLVKA